jgi:hypothetical protein
VESVRSNTSPEPFRRARIIVELTMTTALCTAASLAVATGHVTAWSAAVLTAGFLGFARSRRG